MSKILAVSYLVVLLLSSASFAEVMLPRTDSATSVQSTLFEALYELHLDRPDLVGIGEGSSLVVKDENNSIACEAGPVGMLPVQTYKCVLSAVEYDWKESSVSVQAVLYQALFKLFEMYKNSPYQEANPVEQSEAGALVVEDDHSRFTCDAKSFGLLPVESYSCQLTFKVEPN